ncbi:MAG: CHAT domain-containing protein [Bacteroidetes bacterium]|nr:CHAT domain-containing protein [Bacteroidota bacterium]
MIFYPSRIGIKLLLLIALLSCYLTSAAQNSYEQLKDSVVDLMQSRNYVEAEFKGKLLLNIVASEKGINGSDYQIALDNLALACRENHHYEQSDSLLRKSLAIRLKLYGNPSSEYASGLFNIGRLYFIKGELRTARIWYEQAIQQKKDASNDIAFTRYPVFLENLAELDRQLQDFDSALPLYRELSDIRKTTGDVPRYLTALNGLGICLMNMGSTPDAVSIFQNILKMKIEVYGAQTLPIVSALHNLASCYINLGQLQQGDSILRVSLAIARDKGGIQSQEYLECVNTMTNQLIKESKLKEAEDLLQDALANAHEDVEVLHNIAAIYATQGGNYFDQNRFSDAEQAYRKAINLSESIGEANTIVYAKYLNDLGSAFLTYRKYDSARVYLLKSLKFLGGETNYKGIYYAQVSSNVATYYQAVGNFALSKLYFDSSINLLISEQNEGLKLAELQNDLAKLYIDQGMLSEAQRLLEKAFPIIMKSTSAISQLKLSALDHRAELYYRMGYYNLAWDDAKSSLELKHQVGNINPYSYILSLTLMGYIRIKTLDYEGAEEYFAAAVDTAFRSNDQNYPACIVALSDCYRLEKKYGNAIKLMNEGLYKWENSDLPQDQVYATLVNDKARLYRDIGNFPEAVQLYQKSLSIWEKTIGIDHPFYATGLTNLAEVYISMKNYKAAEESLLKASTITLKYVNKNFIYMSADEKLHWLDRNSTIFSIFPLLLDQDSTASPSIKTAFFDLSVAVRNMVLTDETSKMKRLYTSSDLETREKFDRLQQIRDRLAKQSFLSTHVSEITTDSLQQLSNQLEKELNFQVQSAINQSSSFPIGFADIRNSLLPNEVAVEFLNYRIYDGSWKDSIRYGAFIVRSDMPYPSYVSVCSENDIMNLIAPEGRWQTDMVSIRQFFKSDRPAKIYKLIFGPIQNMISSAHQLDLSMAGLLNYIPINALPISGDSILIDKYQLLTVSNLRLLTDRRHEKPIINPKTDIVLFGDVDFGQVADSAIKTHLPLPRLEGTKEEIEAIDSIAQIRHIRSVKLTDTAANETAFKNLKGNSPTIIHLATHCFFLPSKQRSKETVGALDIDFHADDNPLFRSCIFLAGSNLVWTGGIPIAEKDDGILSAYEISQLDLSRTKLIVLSACESGLGDIKGEEGVFGLQRSLKCAGVENMIVSLWKVPDIQTTRMMILFYENLAKGDNIEEAFEKVQRMMRKEDSPYYWAAFTLVR